MLKEEQIEFLRGIGEAPLNQVLTNAGFIINLTKLEYVKFQIKYRLTEQVSNGLLTLMAYIFLYPKNFKKKFMADGHSSSSQSVDNYVSTIRKMGLLSDDNTLKIGTIPEYYQNLYIFNVTD